MLKAYNCTKTTKWLVSVGIICTTLAAYWGVWMFDFVEYDDGDYVFENYIVQQGITWSGVHWAFCQQHASNWHPVTWVSHMIDCELFGLNSGGHHLTSLMLHMVNGLLLFTLLRGFTGAVWRSGFVAALFALHPLHVESVAWVAERKDVLSTFFGLLTLLIYQRYQQAIQKQEGCHGYYYGLSLLVYALSLMSKPMLVTLPFVMLLLDYWPGKRIEEDLFIRRSSLMRLFKEKLPFFVLSAISCFVTYQAQRNSTVMPLESYGVFERIGNALAAYGIYIQKTIWPVDLAFFYPLVHLPIWEVVVSGLMVIAITVAVFINRRRYAFALTGWLWYLGMLVPVVGIVQVGEQSHADRYTYLPIVGLFIVVVWGVGEWLEKRKRHVPKALSFALVCLTVLGVMTWRQKQHWENTRSLLGRALAVTSGNFLAHNNLGFILAREGDVDAALGHFLEAVRIKPSYARAHRNLAAAFVQQSDFVKAVEHYRIAVHLCPHDAQSLHQLGVVLARQGKHEEGTAACARAVELEPQNPEALYDYALVLNLQGNHKEASARLSQAVQLAPDNPLAHFQLGLTSAQMREWAAAISGFEGALLLRPDWPEALRELAWILTTAEDRKISSPSRAVDLAERANQLRHEVGPLELTTLAVAYAGVGRFDEAIAVAEKAIIVSTKVGMTNLVERNTNYLRLYRERRAYEPDALQGAE